MADKKNILDLLKKNFVLADGGYLLELRFRGYGTPKVILEFPHVVRLLHQDFFRAGSQVLQTLTRWATRTHLEQKGKAGWGGRVEEANRVAVQVARQVAGDEALIAGTVGESAVYRPGDAASHGAAQAEWEEQIGVLVDEGVDFLVCESFPWLEEATLALACCKKTGLPTVACMSGTIWLKKRFKSDEPAEKESASPAECARALADAGADAVGINGGMEPGMMWPHVRAMRQAVDVPVAFLPAGHRTSGPNDWEPFLESVIIPGVEMGNYALRAKAEGIHYIGGDDGAGPELIRGMAESLACVRDRK